MHPRHDQILELLRDHGEVPVLDLAERFSVTPVTIRRDLDALTGEGLVERTHGGAILARRGRIEFTFRQREAAMLGAKQAIARMAAARIPSGCAITLDTGTTTLELARALIHHEKLRVLTSSLPVAAVLHPMPNIELILLGGQTRNDQPDLFGELTEDNLCRFHVDLAVIGTDAADATGLMTTDPHIARVSRTMLRHAASSMLLSDHSKFGRQAFVRFADWQDIDCAIVDAALAPEHRAWIADRLELLIAD